jgi:hypothetical protein
MIRDIQLVLTAHDDGGACQIAIGATGLAFGNPLDATTIDSLNQSRARIEQSLVDQVERPTALELQKFGNAIARVLFNGNVAALYNSDTAGRIQVAISPAGVPLKNVPWEFLVWPDFLQCPHPKRSIARVVPFVQSGGPVTRNLGTRALKVVVIGADVYDVDPITWPEVKDQLERVLGERLRAKIGANKVDVTFVEAADKNTLTAVLAGKSYDIIHFIGHGAPQGILLRDYQAQRGAILPTAALVPLLASADPMLVILSACETGKLDQIAPLGSIAEALVQGGVTAVVANQMKISVPAIVEFSTALYRSLLSTGNIDEAVNMGRIELAVAVAELGQTPLEWAIPVLYRRPGASQLLQPLEKSS